MRSGIAAVRGHCWPPCAHAQSALQGVSLPHVGLSLKGDEGLFRCTSSAVPVRWSLHQLHAKDDNMTITIGRHFELSITAGSLFFRAGRFEWYGNVRNLRRQAVH